MKYKEIYENFKKEINALSYALWLISWDTETEMPVGAFKYKSKQRAVLNKNLLNLYFDENRIKAIEELNKLSLEQPFKKEIELEHKALCKILKVPKEELLLEQILLEESNQVYKKAKKENDFTIFEPTLEKIINNKKKYIEYQQTDELKGYDVLLNDYHEGMTTKDYDEYFALLKKEIVPFIQKISNKKLSYPTILNNGVFPVDKQKEFNHYLLNTLGYDLNHGLLKESVHPFTSSVTQKDVRITTAYSLNDLQSAIFSTIHEMGHGIYEQQTANNYSGSIIEQIESYAMHESQSRLYENMIGRSYEFWKNHYKKLQEIFKEQLKNVTLEDFYKYINKVEKGFIRVNADELTYSIHIMIRYEIEKAIFNNKLEVREIKNLWNKLYEENLGLIVENDTDGVLQDIHWSGGSFGYFPSYSLGSAIASQLYNAMGRVIDINKALLDDNINIINNWLKENIHQFGSYKKPNEIIKDATGEDFNPKYYIDYLIKKHSQIYNIK